MLESKISFRTSLDEDEGWLRTHSSDDSVLKLNLRPKALDGLLQPQAVRLELDDLDPAEDSVPRAAAEDIGDGSGHLVLPSRDSGAAQGPRRVVLWKTVDDQSMVNALRGRSAARHTAKSYS